MQYRNNRDLGVGGFFVEISDEPLVGGNLSTRLSDIQKLNNQVQQITEDLNLDPTIGYALDEVEIGTAEVPAYIVRPDDYNSKGKASYLLIHIHGNGQNRTNNGGPAFKQFCRDNNIMLATINGQDQSNPPFTTTASGWGNQEHYTRYLRLYKYCQDTYNLTDEVILTSGSMGGLVAGHFAYTKPFPIALWVNFGGVPSLSKMFEIESRRPAIRNSYGMAEDGSDDANVADFILGYDWYAMGMLDIAGTPHKVGFPRVYTYAGLSDGIVQYQFGGTGENGEAVYQRYVAALQAAGGFATYTSRADVGHAADELMDDAVNDGILRKELGI